MTRTVVLVEDTIARLHIGRECVGPLFPHEFVALRCKELLAEADWLGSYCHPVHLSGIAFPPDIDRDGLDNGSN